MPIITILKHLVDIVGNLIQALHRMYSLCWFRFQSKDLRGTSCTRPPRLTTSRRCGMQLAAGDVRPPASQRWDAKKKL